MAKYTRKVVRKMHDFGDIDNKKKVIRVNPRKRELLNTVIHEELHRKYPAKPERWIRKKSKKAESNLTISKAIRMLKKYKRK